MSVLDPMWLRWQMARAARQEREVLVLTRVPATYRSILPHTLDVGADRSPLHHLRWSYPSQVKRVWRSWRKRKSSGVARQEIARDTLDAAAGEWTVMLSEHFPTASLAIVYDDLGTMRLMVKFADGGPVIEGVNDPLRDDSWSAWFTDEQDERWHGSTTPNGAVLQAVTRWMEEQPIARAVWLSYLFARMSWTDGWTPEGWSAADGFTDGTVIEEVEA